MRGEEENEPLTWFKNCDSLHQMCEYNCRQTTVVYNRQLLLVRKDTCRYLTYSHYTLLFYTLLTTIIIIEGGGADFQNGAVLDTVRIEKTFRIECVANSHYDHSSALQLAQSKRKKN